MKLSNIDTGIHCAIKAQFVAKGMSAQNADAKAEKHLGEACKLFHAKCKEKPRSRKTDDVATTTYAMRAVVTWARTL